MAFFVVKGIFRGFFREISSLAGIIFGIWIGNHYHPQMADLLKTYIPLEKSLSLISFLLLFIVVVIVFNLSGMLLHHLFKKLLIAWLDRGLGFGLALIKGIIISYLLIVLLIFFIPSKSPLVTKSTTARMVISHINLCPGSYHQISTKPGRKNSLKSRKKWAGQSLRGKRW